MQYLVGQMLLCLLGAGLLGLVIGWLAWGMLVRKMRERSADLEQRVSRLIGYPARLTDLEATHAAFIASKNEEDAKCKARIAKLEPLAARAPELEKSLAAKTAEWEGLRVQIDGKTSELATLQAKLSDLESRHLGEVAQLKPLAALVPELKARVEEKDSHIADLTARVEQHESALAEKDSRIEDLAAQLERPVAAAHAERDEHIAELVAAAALVPELKASLDEKDTHVGALLSRVEELQPLAARSTDLQSQLESVEYEHNLTTRKLHVAEAGAAAHEAEIANLHDQILMHKAEIQSVKQEQAKAETVPLKAMAAAAGASAIGFYDVNEASAMEVAPQVVPRDHVRQFEKRIEELRTIESSKDDEIAKLRSKLTDIEAAPDPDTRRQILFAAKNAELTHLRGVLNLLLQPVGQDEIALRAFTYAKDRNFNGGSANEDWLRAERDVHYSRLARAWESTWSGTMY